MFVVIIHAPLSKRPGSFILAENVYRPSGDQPEAIEKLSTSILSQSRSNICQTLLGVTGSGKTYTIANVISQVGKNTLVISHNKTLAAQLYTEFKEFFPKNNVGYFVSFYDYYQPESYLPQTDTYIEKDTEVNEKIEKMRLEATAMLMSGDPTIIVSTVSCIYSLGSPIEWEQGALTLAAGMKIDRKVLIHNLIESRYERNDFSLKSGAFRVKGDTVDVIPGYSDDIIRVALFGDEIEKITIHSALDMGRIREAGSVKIFPAKHYIMAESSRSSAIDSIKNELDNWLPKLPSDLERQRLASRTKYDIEMIKELGYCSGIKKYSRHVIFVSATPSNFEVKLSSQIVEQLVRPTGLVDPKVTIRGTQNQMQELIREISTRSRRNQRTLVTTLTKRMAEDLAEYLAKNGVRVRYLHSEIEGLERTELIRQLRAGEFDVLVGINLLREGLDIPEVSLVAILDADKEGFLRNTTSLIQTFGRAARNIKGSVIMFADNTTDSMKKAIAETERRREKQIRYNNKFKITPRSVTKPIPESVQDIYGNERSSNVETIKSMTRSDLLRLAVETESTMKKFADDLDFENAIKYRQKLIRIQKALGEEQVLQV